jgi:protein-S-isoprenylcysteine O-methyltransferase Ste14
VGNEGNKLLSWALVLVQFGAVAGLLMTGPVAPRSIVAAGLAGTGLVLGLWAFASMNRQTINVLPDVRDGGTLVTQGPYRTVRHPMYTALLLMTFALILEHWTLARLLIWLLLAGDLFAKLTYEERLLAQRFPDYAAYRARTKRLIPFLW